ncbi:UNVERIFIED_ORG: hypothetical protein M2438_002846 [Methylobacterium sp. SuP10 SLI 274]|nr:hypothetical protein [Methylorubrum extorquens]MDF9864079.1 hypothetical protein [Methylorubrum pseudosasae]MDH6637671.1 hypothetical protein [Methylobacterium sp. SuP10 SLI 274]MDH6666851.1 hypothetical protein [Methylorubrum zatmanii]
MASDDRPLALGDPEFLPGFPEAAADRLGLPLPSGPR